MVNRKDMVHVQAASGRWVWVPRETLAVWKAEQDEIRAGRSPMEDEAYKDLRKQLELDKNSQVLMFSTEGDTDPDKYMSITWGGEYPSV